VLGKPIPDMEYR